jgi:hypothetical protein
MDDLWFYINFVHWLVYVDDQSQCREKIIFNYYIGCVNYCGVHKYRARIAQNVHFIVFLNTAVVTVHPGGCRLSMHWSFRLQEHDKTDICMAMPKPRVKALINSAGSLLQAYSKRHSLKTPEFFGWGIRIVLAITNKMYTRIASSF